MIDWYNELSNIDFTADLYCERIGLIGNRPIWDSLLRQLIRDVWNRKTFLRTYGVVE